MSDNFRNLPGVRRNRRQITRSAFAAAVVASASGTILPGSGALAAQDATPGATPQLTPPEGIEQVDLTNPSPDVPEPTQPVTITFASWVGSSDVLQALRGQFQELHPNITVDFEDVPAEEFTDRLTTRIAGGNPPDVAFMDQSAVVDFASRNALLELGPYAEKSAAVKVDDYVEAFLNAALWEDKLYGLPFDGE